MTRKGPTKLVDGNFGEGRLRLARAFLKSARDAAESAVDSDVGNPIVSQIVNAAIGFADALATKFGTGVNRQDHSAAVKNLRDALGKRLPTSQENRLRRILGEKEAAQYGVRIMHKKDAKKLLQHLEEFATWAEAELRRPR